MDAEFPELEQSKFGKVLELSALAWSSIQHLHACRRPLLSDTDIDTKKEFLNLKLWFPLAAATSAIIYACSAAGLDVPADVVARVGGVVQLGVFLLAEISADVPVRRLVQRRRLYLHRACKSLENSQAFLREYVASLLTKDFGTTLKGGRNNGGVCFLQDFHRVRGTDVVFHAEMATCRFPSDICDHLHWKLLHHWALADTACGVIDSIPE
jgi:hypothetical protein